ncbi:MAG: hypothetical protein K6A23_15920 [Butyrivibrio sp.]|nr:hypothetical protein [Butyrivibrio sp.]
MEKRLRNVIRHMDKLDIDLLSEEEYKTEKENLLIQIDFLHEDMLHNLIGTSALLICTAIAAVACILNFEMIFIVLLVVFAFLTLAAGNTYNERRKGLKQLYGYFNKLIERQ